RSFSPRKSGTGLRGISRQLIAPSPLARGSRGPILRRGDPTIAQRVRVRPVAAGVMGQHLVPAAQRAIERRIENVAKLFFVTLDRTCAVAEKIGGRPSGERS